MKTTPEGKSDKPLCAQCNDPMRETHISWIYVCSKPECPSFALLQTDQNILYLVNQQGL